MKVSNLSPDLAFSPYNVNKQHHQHFVRYEDNSFNFIKLTMRGKLPLDALTCFLQNSKKHIKDLILNDVYPGEYHLPNVTNVHFIRDTGVELKNDRKLFLSKNSFENSSQQFFIHISHAGNYHINQYNNYLSSNVKLIPSKISFYGQLRRIKAFQLEKLNDKFDPNKYKKLKNCKNILWAGNIHRDRQADLDFLQKHSLCPIVCSPEYIDFRKQSYIDVLLQHDSFCALSLDGVTPQCFRDTELGLSRVFNLKYTRATQDISANNTLYVSRNIEEFNSHILQIKKSIFDEDYTSLHKSHLYMKNLHILHRKGFFTDFLEVCCELRGVSLDNLILHNNVGEKINDKQWNKIVRNKFYERIY